MSISDCSEQIDPGLPLHIGFIMDGNGRWAKKRGLPRSMGHKEGAKTFRKIVECCADRHIQYATFYTFSTENWKRPADEVESIMDLLRDYLQSAFNETENANKYRTKFIGDMTPLASDIKDMISKIEKRTENNTGLTVNIALNYGGRQELLHAVKTLTSEVLNGTINSDDLTEDSISQALYTADQPDVDLIIRPSGEYRLSNFLIWQAAYAEFVFMDEVLWPDFSAKHLDAALEEFRARNRRFGGI